MRPRNQPEILLRRADRSDLGALLSLIHRFANESGESGGGVVMRSCWNGRFATSWST